MDKGRARALLDSHIAGEASALQRELSGESEDSGNPLLNAAGTVGSKALSILDVGNKFVTRPAMGWLAKQAVEHDLHSGWSEEEQEAIRGAESYTEAWNARDISGFEKFLVEAIGDPLNLVGVGLIGKLRHAANAPDAARALGLINKPGMKQIVDRAEAFDEILSRGMALPVTLPVRGVRRGYQAIDEAYQARTGKSLGEVTPRFKAMKEVGKFLGSIRGIDPNDLSVAANDPGEYRRIQDLRAQADRLRQIPKNERFNRLRDTDEMDLARAYRWAKEEIDNDLMPDIEEAMRSRGLMDEGNNLQPRLRAHTDLEEVLRNQAGISSPQERQLFHETLDHMAEMIPRSQSWKSSIFKSADDVYQHFNVAGLAGVDHDSAVFQKLSKQGEKMLAEHAPTFRTTDSVADLLSAPGFPKGLADWYADSAELIFHLGFDYSPMYNQRQIARLLDDNVMQEAMQDLNMTREQASERLSQVTKLDAFTSFLGGGSQNEGPKRNLFHAYRLARNSWFGWPTRGDVPSNLPDDVVPGTSAWGDMVTPAATDLGEQAKHGFRQMLDPSAGAFNKAYLDARAAGKVPAGTDPTETIVHPWGDKMNQFALTFKEEVDALAIGYRTYLSTGDQNLAREARQTAREAIQYYVSDRWDRKIWTQLVDRIKEPEFMKLLDDFNSGANVSRDRIRNAANKLMSKPAMSKGTWLTLKHKVHNEVFPSLTNRPRADGQPLEYVHPNWQEFRERFPNPSALQAELWYRVQIHDKVAFQILVESLFDADNVLRTMRAGASTNTEVLEQVSRMMDDIYQNLPESMASDPKFQNPSLKHIAGFRSGTLPSFESPSSVDVFDNPAMAQELEGRLGRRFRFVDPQTGEVSVLPIPGSFKRAAIGDIDPLYQKLGDDLIKGAFTKQAKGGIVHLGTHSDVTTAVHELFGHYFPEFAGDPDSIRMIRGVVPGNVGEELPWNRETKELFATGIENFLRTERPNDPRIAQFFEDFQRLAQESDIPQQVLSPRAKQMITGRMTGTYVSPFPEGHFGSRIEDKLHQTTDYAGTRPAGTPGPTQDLTELSPDASIDEVTTRISTELGISKEQMQPVNKLLHQYAGVNTQYFRAANMLFDDHQYGLLAQAALNPERAEDFVAQALYEAGNRAGAWGLQMPILNRVYETLGTIGEPQRAVRATQAIGRTDQGGLLINDMDNIRQAMGYEPVRQLQDEYEAQTSFIDNVLREIKERNPTSQFVADNETTYRDIVNAMDWGSTEQKRMLEEYLDRWGITKQFRKEAHSSQLADAYHQALREELGIKDVKEAPWMTFFRKGQRGWREQALLSVRYHFANGLDMVTKGVVFGVNPVFPRSSAFHFMKSIGFENLPDSIRSDFLRDATARAEFQQPGGESVLGSIPGVGRPLGWLVDRNRTLAMWMETSARAAAWRHGAIEHLQKSFKPAFTNQVRRLGKQYRLQDKNLTDLMQDIKKSGVEFSAEDARNLVLNRTGNQAYADEVANLWQRGIREASQVGEDLALRVHFDFADEREWERLLRVRDILPFHIWATRNIPFYLQTMAQNPWILRVFETYHDVQSQEMMDMNLTPRFREKLGVPEAANPIIGLFLGPGTHFFNPTVAFSIADQFKEPYIPDDPQGLERFGNLLRQGQRFGFSFAPWIDLPMNAAGVYGAREPFGIWRHGDLVASGLGSAGIHADYRPTQRAVEGIRGSLPWNEDVETYSGSGFLDRDINTRIRELALAEAGDPEHPEYMRAMTDPDSDLYKRAKRDVMKRRFREQVFGSFIHNIPHARLPDYERERRAVGPRQELSSEAAAWLMDRGHPSTDFWGVPSDARRAQISSGFAQTRGMNREQREATLAGQDLPWFWNYLEWLFNRPEGADTSVDAFLAEEG